MSGRYFNRTVTAGGQPDGAVAPTPPTLTLGTLSLAGSLTSGVVSSGGITGATSGSTITSNVSGLSVDSAARTYSFNGSTAGTVANGLVETLSGASNSPNATSITVAAAVSLGNLSLSGSLTAGTASSGSISGATSGSTITSNVTGLTVNSGARTYSFDGTATAGTVANGLVETLSGASNSPKSNSVVVAAATGGTSVTRYSIAASRFRTPVNVRAASGSNLFFVGQFVFGSPDYAINNPRFFMPTWYQAGSGSSSPETAVGNVINIEGVSILIGGTWYPAPSASFPIAMDPSVVAGVLLPAIAGVTIPAGSTVTCRVAYNVPSGGSVPTTPRNVPLGESIQGGTATLSAKLTDGSTLTNVNGHADAYQPLYMIAQGGDGRPALVSIGDSIGYGANEASSGFSSAVSLWTTRGAFGYLVRGLDSNTGTKRIMLANLCVPGSRPLDITARDSNFSKKKLDSIKAAYDATGDWPFDEVISQHGTNSVSGSTSVATLIAGMQTYLNVLKTEWGKPITQVELIAKTATTDGYATLAGMTPSAQDSYNNGSPGSSNQRWSLNAAIGTNGNPDPATTLRSGGYIQDSFAPWVYGSYDTGNNRDKLKIRSFATTLAAAAAQNASSFTMTAAPTVGEYLNIANTADGNVLTVSGSGPYTVGMVMTSQVPSGGLASGSAVQAQEHALDGTHPGPFAHRDDYAQAVTAWKTRRGWV